MDLEDALKEIVYFRGVAYVLIGTCYLNPDPDPLCPKSNYTYYASLVRSECTKIIKNCTYNDEDFPCCEYFQPIETDIGPCFILNSIQTKYVLHVTENILRNFFCSANNFLLQRASPISNGEQFEKSAERY